MVALQMGSATGSSCDGFCRAFRCCRLRRGGSRMTNVNLPGLQAAQVVGDVYGMRPQRLEGHYIEGAFVG